MSFEDIPIHIFVSQRFSSHSVQRVVENWRVEPSVLIDRLIDHFKEMGIFRVARGHEGLIMKNMIHQLKSSPEISRMVYRARQEEMRRQRNRHAE